MTIRRFIKALMDCSVPVLTTASISNIPIPYERILGYGHYYLQCHSAWLSQIKDRHSLSSHSEMVCAQTTPALSHPAASPQHLPYWPPQLQGLATPKSHSAYSTNWLTSACKGTRILTLTFPGCPIVEPSSQDCRGRCVQVPAA